MIPFELALGTALRHWKAILGGIVLLGLSVALLLAKADARHWKKRHGQEATAHQMTVANYRTAQAEATAKAERQRRDLEESYRRNADVAENEYATGLAQAGDRATAYIAANRVRAQGAQCEGSGTVAATGDQRPSVSAPMPTAPELVSVTPGDVRACAAAVNYADEAHSWSMTLNAKP